MKKTIVVTLLVIFVALVVMYVLTGIAINEQITNALLV